MTSVSTFFLTSHSCIVEGEFMRNHWIHFHLSCRFLCIFVTLTNFNIYRYLSLLTYVIIFRQWSVYSVISRGGLNNERSSSKSILMILSLIFRKPCKTWRIQKDTSDILREFSDDSASGIRRSRHRGRFIVRHISVRQLQMGRLDLFVTDLLQWFLILYSINWKKMLLSFIENWILTDE